MSRDALTIILFLHFAGWTTASFAAADGEGGASEADSLNRQVVELYGAGKYQEAIPLARQLLEITEKLNGLEHGDTVASLNNLAALYKMAGAYAEAEPLYRQALAIREKSSALNIPIRQPVSTIWRPFTTR